MLNAKNANVTVTLRPVAVGARSYVRAACGGTRSHIAPHVPSDANHTVRETGNWLLQGAVEPDMAIVITKRQRRGVVVAALAVLTLAVVVVSIPDGDDGVHTAGDAESRVAAESELPPQDFELFDGATATFDEFEGTPLVINFWASWCPACVSELPEFQAVHEQRSDEVTFIGIANADIRPAAVGLAAEVGLTYSLADDPDGVLFREFGLIAMPSTLFVSPGGEILEVFAGQLNESALNDRIDRLVADS